MTTRSRVCTGVGGVFLLFAVWQVQGYQGPAFYGHGILQVLLLSIDGMHALDFANCSKGVSGANNGEPYCPNLVRLAQFGVNYLVASATRPSDSFPGMAAQFTGGSSRSTGFYYDVSYNRALSPPRQ